MSAIGITWNADLFLDIKDELSDTSASETALIRHTNVTIKDILASLDPPSTIRQDTVYFCGEPYTKYDYPTEAKSNAIIDLRPRDNVNIQPLKFLSSYKFRQYNYGEVYTLDYDQDVECLKILHDLFPGNSVFISGCNTSLTNDGTWTAGSGVSNITYDSYNYKEGDGAINFDVSGTTATISFVKSSVIDISGMTIEQRLRFFMKLPTAPTSIAVRWGNDSSNYYSHSITTQADGASFNTTDWNELEAVKSSATMTGTVDDEAIDYFALVITFSGSTTDTDFIIDHIKAIKPEAMILEYYSRYGAKTAAGVYGDDLTVTASTTDLVNLYEEWRNILIYGACWRYLNGKDAKRAEYYRQLYEGEKMKLKIKYPSRRKHFSRRRVLSKLNSL